MRGTVLDFTTTPHRPVAGVAVVLRAWRSGRLLGSAQGRTDAGGRFALPAPALPPGGTYTATATYKGVPYDMAVTTGARARPLRLAVYDTTASDAGLAAMRVLIGLRRQGHRLAVIEQWTFVNAGVNGPLTVAGADPATGRGAATFPLPPGASHVVIQDVGPAPATATAQRGAVVVNTIMRPATGLNAASFHQIRFTFEVTDGAGHPTLLIPTRYFIGTLEVFAIGSRLVAPGFKPSTLPVGGQRVPALTMQAVLPGNVLAVGVDGPPIVPAAPAAPAPPPPFPLAPVVLAIEVGFLGLLLFGLRGRPFTATRPRDRLALQRERARLIGAIAALDAQHAQGSVDEAEYRRQRAGEKGRLLDVARQLGE